VPLVVLVGETEPQADDVQAAPFCVSVQFTPLFPTSFITVAVNFCVPFTPTAADVGEIVTPIPWTVIVAEADCVESVTEVAVSATVVEMFGAV